MGIVNHTYYPYIYSTPETTRVEYRTESGGYWSIRDWHDGNNYWLFENGLRETVYALHAAKRKIVLVTDVPDLNNYPNNLVMRTKFNGEKLNDLTPKRALYESNNKEVFICNSSRKI